MRRRREPGVLVIDLRPIARAVGKMVRALRGLTPSGQLEIRRARWGGNGTDARRWPDQWQSAVCSAWLHESCPSASRDLGCTCRCHRRSAVTTRPPAGAA